ncbi:Ubiquitin-conjugating enzyme E2 14 [Coemansia sp. RSA 2424]|nr:Ubiquitin-conjugating enzyme E2 14 [Coemansia sp. RSA 2424]
MFGPEGTLYDEGIFQAVMAFPTNYPYAPPTLTFKTKIWHPNIFLDGRVCISILHDAGDDPHQYEDAGERWSPAQSVESILLSVVSILSSPNPDSPANVEAAKEMRTNYAAFRKKVRETMNSAEENAS